MNRTYSDELYHHGIKGMKWGVRRFQNKDGSLTNAGKIRYSKTVDINNIDREDLLKTIGSGRDFVIKKGSEAYRSTTADEITKGKKYVSFRATDIPIYEEFVRESVANPGDSVYTDTYSTAKNTKVAGLRSQAEVLQEMYGRTVKNKSLIDSFKKRGEIDDNIMSKPISEMTDSEFKKYIYYNPFSHDLDIMNKPISSVDTSTFIERLKDKGYDAVVDMVDTTIGYADAPVVILDSEKSLKRKSRKSD